MTMTTNPPNVTTCPPLVRGPVVEMRHAIACWMKAGRSPIPAGASITQVRQTWNQAQCEAYIGQWGTDAPAAPAALAEIFGAPAPAPTPAPTPARMGPSDYSPAADLLASLQAFVQSTAPAQPAAQPATGEALEALRADVMADLQDVKGQLLDQLTDVVRETREGLQAAREAASNTTRAIVLHTPEGTPRGAVVADPHPLLEMVCTVVLTGKPVMLAGPAGVGKTHLAQQVAAALGLEFGLHGAAMMGHELVGYADANGRFVDTVASRQFREGGLTCFDEHDAGSEAAPLVLNALLANRVMAQGSTMVPAHADWRCVATCNTLDGATSTYTGRVKLDGATLNRYFVVHIDYVEAIEERLSAGQTGWLALCRKARAEIQARGIPTVAGTYRDIEAGAQLLASGVPLQAVADGLLCRGGVTRAMLGMR